jgi:hypothetical protein|tara:strand:+ start:4575 stop:4805 length:231 start_codon:yes stop_codon:yes gene_type:complete
MRCQDCGGGARAGYSVCDDCTADAVISTVPGNTDGMCREQLLAVRSVAYEINCLEAGGFSSVEAMRNLSEMLQEAR